MVNETFKCFRREVLESINFEQISSLGYAFQIEINYFTWKKGFKIFETPIVFTDRKRGVSKMSSNVSPKPSMIPDFVVMPFDDKYFSTEILES